EMDDVAFGDIVFDDTVIAMDRMADEFAESDYEFEGGYEPDLEGEMPLAPLEKSLAPLENIPWDAPGVMPDSLEVELIEAWLVDPNSFEVFSTKIPVEWLLSPITRLVHQVCREFCDRGLTPTFDRLMTRFDDAKMKTLLVTWDESASEKQLKKREPYCDPQPITDQLIVEIVEGFERRNERRSRPKEIGRLKAENLSDEDKLQLLMEIQQKQRTRHGLD
ncbi:MAG: hypothetical protein FWD31_07315, partial [Planctomycetaceae bacterium]|nr:hypothetical protein [Planctomycetaceae bacterium]